MSFSIGQFSNLLGVSPSTVRYYEEEGLLQNVERRHGRRIFYKADVDAFKLILAARNTGFTLSEIKALLIERETKADFRQVIKNAALLKINTLDEKLQKLQLQRETLNQALGCFCEDIVVCATASA